ncbi:GNAT family N-acetyltransferase [Enterococcus sp.]|uniref:GNAT family N-acetyltransferase n=1 Tax=Enterococcus sp. TaxID=35783 RepID=UPI002FCA8A72
MEIQTKRCIIRPFNESDINRFMDYRNDMDWMQYQGFKGLTKEEYAEVLLGGNDLNSGMQLAIVDTKNSWLIGDVYLKQEEENCWIGYSICRSEARKGYAYEAVTAVINHLKKRGIKTVKAGVASDNVASIELLRKLEFIYLGFAENEMTFAFKL